MSAKDLEKFCGNTPEKPEEKNKKKFVFKNNKIYKPLSEFTDEDWKEASRRAEETDIRDFIDLDRFREDVNIYKKSTAFCCAFL